MYLGAKRRYINTLPFLSFLYCHVFYESQCIVVVVVEVVVRFNVIIVILILILITTTFQRVSDLEAELTSKSQTIGSLNTELAELKEKAVNIDDLQRSVRDLQKQVDVARDASDVTQQKNTELRQSLKSKDKQIEVNNWRTY